MCRTFQRGILSCASRVFVVVARVMDVASTGMAARLILHELVTLRRAEPSCSPHACRYPG
jgi:hypothetical protein